MTNVNMALNVRSKGRFEDSYRRHMQDFATVSYALVPLSLLTDVPGYMYVFDKVRSGFSLESSAVGKGAPCVEVPPSRIREDSDNRGVPWSKTCLYKKALQGLLNEKKVGLPDDKKSGRRPIVYIHKPKAKQGCLFCGAGIYGSEQQ